VTDEDVTMEDVVGAVVTEQKVHSESPPAVVVAVEKDPIVNAKHQHQEGTFSTTPGQRWGIEIFVGRQRARENWGKEVEKEEEEEKNTVCMYVLQRQNKSDRLGK